jgi:AcrR family transcriptional regulator
MEIREEQILKRSESLFRKRGFKRVTMDEIAREMGMSKKTVYKYFTNKRDLVLKNIRLKIELEKSQFCVLHDESKDAVEEMMRLIRHVIDMFEKNNPAVFAELKRYYPGSWTLMDGFIRKHVHQRIHQNIERGKREGLYREDIDSDILAKMYVAKVKSIMEEDWFPKSRYNKRHLLEVLIEYHIRGIAADPGLQLFDEYKKAGLLNTK